MRISISEPLHRHHFHNERIGFVDRLFVTREEEEPNFNRRMFDEDFAMLFPPIIGQSADLFVINSNDEELAGWLLGNVETRYSPHVLDEIIRELVEEIAESLIWCGRAFYFVHSESGTDNLRVVSFDPNSVVRINGTHFQWVPKRKETHWDREDEELPREIRILEAAKVLRIDTPKSIKRLLSRQKRTLAALDKHQLTGNEFHTLATHENPNPTNDFDFRAWSNTQESVLYRATRWTGWSARKYDSSKRSDFFVCNRLIRFRRNQLVLRDDILSQLGNELSRIGNRYNPDFSIKISGSDELPTVAHLEELELNLLNEQVGFGEIMDYCY